VSALLPEGVTEASVQAQARRRGVGLSRYGESIALPGTPAGLLVGFGLTSADQLPDALGALHEALATVA
jgi:DNA-binding transcriptional MocR family regulator